ncbi:MAG: elongation factor P [Nitrospirae bacterium GWC2_56_14]|nr:MAG: elongation factor P [Nitrospirae bacterium GWC2_56_14]
MPVSTTEFRNGLKIEIDGEPYVIVEFQHVKPGKGGAFVRTKFKSLKSGNVTDKTFRAGEKVDVPNLEEKTMQYLYAADKDRVFMDTSSYEQVSMSEKQLGDSINYLKENMEIKVLYHKEQPINIEVPMFVELAIAKTDPGVRGDTASGGSKPATLESGAVIKVPFYLNEGDVVKVDTRTGTFIERVKK